MLRALVPAAIVSILAATSASAMPAAAPLAHLNTIMPAETVQIQHREESNVRRGKAVRHYTPGRRYSKAPSNYRRYAQRPSDWRSRGCILVGPVWFCA